MKKEYYRNHRYLAYNMIQKAMTGYYTVAALFFEDAAELIRELILTGDVGISSIEISDPQINGYDREYYISISDDLTVDVEPAFYEDRYLATGADLILVDSNASSLIIQKEDPRRCREVYIGNLSDYDEIYENFDF